MAQEEKIVGQCKSNVSKEYIEALDRNMVVIREKDYTIIEKALQRLESIDNSKSSEALDQINYMLSDCIMTTEIEERLEIIKQYILKAQEQEKVLSIIKEKNVDTKLLRECNSVNEYNAKIKKDYNSFYYKKYRLTQEEFDLLKRWIG